MLHFVDERLGSFGFLPWQPFEHPQLGPVEIGGWQIKFLFQNAPAPLLEEISRRNAAFTLRAAACAPRMRLAETLVEPLGGGLYRVQAIAENQGFLPTNVTERAVTLKALAPDKLELRHNGDVELVAGEAEQVLGFLPGRSDQYEPQAIFLSYGRPNRRKGEWIVRAKQPGATITLAAISQRGGRAEQQLRLA
jgi:hypothetical protein